jgi:hypothetical protein
MDANPWKTRRKTLSLRNYKIEEEPSTWEKSITTPEVATQAGGEVGGEAKIDRCTTCITKEIRITRQEIVQYFWSPRKR